MRKFILHNFWRQFSGIISQQTIKLMLSRAVSCAVVEQQAVKGFVIIQKVANVGLKFVVTKFICTFEHAESVIFEFLANR